MPYENINTQLSLSDEADIRAKIEAVFALLPFLINLTKKERKQKTGQGRHKELFIITAFEIAQTNPLLVPQKLSMLEWENDIELHTQLISIHRRLKQLEEAINDTLLALKAEKSKSASVFYNTLKIFENSNIVDGIDTMVGKLKGLL
jgi:hypothetical protein